MVNGRRHAALQGVDPDRRRRERKNNIVNARANAREERLNHRRRLDADPNQEAQLATNVSSAGPARGLEELQTNVRFRNRCNVLMLHQLHLLVSCLQASIVYLARFVWSRQSIYSPARVRTGWYSAHFIAHRTYFLFFPEFFVWLGRTR